MKFPKQCKEKGRLAATSGPNDEIEHTPLEEQVTLNTEFEFPSAWRERGGR